MLPNVAGSNAISTSTKADVNMIDSINHTTFISLSRYNDLLYIEQNISSIINYKVQQILDMERMVERKIKR